ncbi:hypothetical protein D3C72_2274040 [compost metagenome]
MPYCSIASLVPRSANLPLAAKAPDMGTGAPKRITSVAWAMAERLIRSEAGAADRAAS